MLNWFWKYCIRRTDYTLNVPFRVSSMMRNYAIIQCSINKSITKYFTLSFHFLSNKFRLSLAGPNPDFASVNEFLDNRGFLVSFLFLSRKTSISSFLSKYWVVEIDVDIFLRTYFLTLEAYFPRSDSNAIYYLGLHITRLYSLSLKVTYFRDLRYATAQLLSFFVIFIHEIRLSPYMRLWF